MKTVIAAEIENDFASLLAATPLNPGKSVTVASLKFTFYPINMLDLVALVDEDPDTRKVVFGGITGDKDARAHLKSKGFAFGADTLALVIAASARRPQDKHIIRSLPPQHLNPIMATALPVIMPAGMQDFLDQFVGAVMVFMGGAEEQAEAA